MKEDTPLIVPTDRCLLRPSTPCDYDALVAGIAAPEFPPELPLANFYQQGKLKSWFDSMLAMSLDGKACLFSIDLRTGERCVGQISLLQRDESASWNLAFWLHPSHWDRGLALETAAATIRYAFAFMGIQEIWAGAARWNQRSIRTLLKLGLQQVDEVEPSNGESDSQNAFRAFAISRDRWTRARPESNGVSA
jgi:RimJ/RimL family protein N-acetyltransferase